MPDCHVDHAVLAGHAQNKVNVPADQARERRRQVNHLRSRLEEHIAAHPGYDLVKLRAAGSTAKHTAIRLRRGEGSDADVAAYVRASSVGGIDADESGLLGWLKDRCIEVYGATKDAEDFVISEHAVGITLRGSGLKIDVATLIGDAFACLLTQDRKARGGSEPGSVFILVVDEADALAQSRAAEQMHHEDRAGVDALLAGVDSLAGEAVLVLVIMCTNRERALDPAVLRRAAAIFHFSRPDEAQRYAVLAAALASTGIDTEAISKLAALTGPAGGRPGFTYSDLTQRLIPAAILTAFPDKPLTADLLLAAAASTDPTPEFCQAP
jgi:ATPase family associated with various cellular activities (AAA)